MTIVETIAKAVLRVTELHKTPDGRSRTYSVLRTQWQSVGQAWAESGLTANYLHLLKMLVVHGDALVWANTVLAGTAESPDMKILLRLTHRNEDVRPLLDKGLSYFQVSELLDLARQEGLLAVYDGHLVVTDKGFALLATEADDVLPGP